MKSIISLVSTLLFVSQFNPLMAEMVGPTAICKDITVSLDVDGIVFVDGLEIDDGSFDDGSIVSYNASPSEFSCTDLGINSVTLTVTDDEGLTDQCISQVTIVDDIAPIMDCPVDFDAYYEAPDCFANVVWFEPFVLDNCNWMWMENPGEFMMLEVGVHPITYVVADDSGNETSCTFNVTVFDTIAPFIYFDEPNIVLSNDPGFCDASDSIPVPYIDECTAYILTNNFNGSSDASGTYPVGTTIVNWTATDAFGNVRSAIQEVVVEDNSSPVAICQDITVQLDATGIAVISLEDIDAGSTDNCGVDSIALSQTVFTALDVGINLDTLWVTDLSGNTATCIAEVTVTETLPWDLICQDTFLYIEEAGVAELNPESVISGIDPEAIDTLILSQTTFTCMDLGSNGITIQVIDTSGLSDQCAAIVDVIDNIAPVAVCSDTSIHLDQNGVASIDASFLDGGSFDNCFIDSLALDIYEVDCSFAEPPSTLEVTLIALDSWGNSSTCISTITVIDELAPELSNCPTDTSIAADANCIGVITWSEPIPFDNCSYTWVEQPDNFLTEPVGEYQITYAVEDPSGNQATCFFTIAIVDISAPIAICKDTFNLYFDDPGTQVVLPSDIDAGSTDECAIDSMMVVPNTFSSGDAGSHIVELIVTDAAGNQGSCSSIVTVDIDLGMEAFSETSFDFYPNPNHGMFTIEFVDPTQAYELTILDITGKQMHRQFIGKGKRRIQIESQNPLMPGVYVLNLVNQETGQSLSKRMVVK
jgi:hypothetical protein